MLPKTAQELKQAFSTLLDIPNIEIEKVELDREGNYVVVVKSTEAGTHCHKCGESISHCYGHGEPITLRHLSLFDKQVYIRIRPARYQCRSCDGYPTTTQRLSWYEPRSPQTVSFEKHILLSCVNSTVWDVSRKEGLGYEAVMGIIDRTIEKEIDWATLELLEVVGLDEISLKKGHQDFVTIVTGRVGGETHILGVLKDRTKVTVKAFLSSIPKRLRKKVQAVCSDMYDGFINAAKEVFGKKVVLVVDRFHVAKLYRNGVEQLRKQELKRLKEELSEADYKELKGVMWLLRKRDEDLTAEEREVLAKLFTYSPTLKQAYVLSTDLTAIFDMKISKAQGKRKLTAWIKRVSGSTLICFNSFLVTLEKYKDEISNYFIHRHNSGFVEGLNNKIKVIKRRCYGIVNTGHLFQRIYLDLSGYRLYA
ncbi:MAG: ISL3 family transposase [bacterium]|nr:ISL3 family transposase [bacterium]